MTQRKRDVLFLLYSLAVGGATAGIFVVIAFTGAAYVYENNKAILFVELSSSTGFAIWAFKRLVGAIKKEGR